MTVKYKHYFISRLIFIPENKKVASNFENLLKFGWKETGEVLSETSSSTISEMLLSTVAVYCFRCNPSMLKENSSKSLKYLNLIDRNSLGFPFLFHYLYGQFDTLHHYKNLITIVNTLIYPSIFHCYIAFANFNIGNSDASLYHLQHAALSRPSFFMQARSKTLQGQILLSQEKASAALEILQSVQYKRKEVQLPLCAFLIASAYQQLGKFKHQIDVLNLLANVSYCFYCKSIVIVCYIALISSLFSVY